MGIFQLEIASTFPPLHSTHHKCHFLFYLNVRWFIYEEYIFARNFVRFQLQLFPLNCYNIYAKVTRLSAKIKCWACFHDNFSVTSFANST